MTGCGLSTLVSSPAVLRCFLTAVSLGRGPQAGLRNARAKGKKFGRPRAEIDAGRVAALRREGLSWAQVCRTLNVSKGSAQRSVARLTKSYAEHNRNQCKERGADQ